MEELKYRNKRKERILSSQSTGHTFAFVLINPNITYWIVVDFIYVNVYGKPYIIEKQKIGPGIKITPTQNIKFETIEELIDYLVIEKVDPNLCRAMH